jgi:imidazolonepropionase-like amidohydrolase
MVAPPLLRAVTRLIRSFALSALTLLLGGCGDSARHPEPETLVLRGFYVVDPQARSVSEADLLVERGVVVRQATASRQRVIEGNGRYLMPALWDLKASLWGNGCLLDWDQLSQGLSFTHSLGVQLYYGVAHVGVFAMPREWVGRYLRRAEALEMTAAESLYPDAVLCGASSFACTAVTGDGEVRQVLDARKRDHAPFVFISYLDSKEKEEPTRGVTRAVLATALREAHLRGLASIVLVDDWQRVREAAELGASVIYGFPANPVTDDVATALLEHGAVFAPALTLFLEADRLLGSVAARRDPFLVPTVSAPLLASFESERGTDASGRLLLAQGRARKQAMLDSVRKLSERGVKMVVTSDAGWAPGSFQGAGSHAAQAWLERAHVDGWSRLAAATVTPAKVFGRRVGFEPGDAADFLALDANPLESAANLRRIELVIRQGRVVDRASLLPDLERGNYRR